MISALRLCLRRTADEPTPDGRRRVQFSLRVPTTLDVVEEAVDLVARHCVAGGLAPEMARFNLRVVLSEALVNAIVYGNGLDPLKCVDVRVEVDGVAVAIHVRDEGDGFDPSQVPDPTGPGRIERADGRGLFLIRKLADEVHFNERGNAICMIMRCA